VTFIDLFFKKDPCKKCIVDATCSKRYPSACDKFSSYSSLKIDRDTYWNVEFPTLIFKMLLLIVIVALVRLLFS